MATNEQIEDVLAKLENAHLEQCFKCVNETQMGIRAVLRVLCESTDAVTAGRISEVLCISTARVAVLLKKMVAKGLVIKERDTLDARKTIVRLTASGQETVRQMRDEIYEQLERVIDAVGEARVMEFLAIAEDIHGVMKETAFTF